MITPQEKLTEEERRRKLAGLPPMTAQERRDFLASKAQDATDTQQAQANTAQIGSVRTTPQEGAKVISGQYKGMHPSAAQHAALTGAPPRTGLQNPSRTASSGLPARQRSAPAPMFDKNSLTPAPTVAPMPVPSPGPGMASVASASAVMHNAGARAFAAAQQAKGGTASAIARGIQDGKNGITQRGENTVTFESGGSVTNGIAYGPDGRVVGRRGTAAPGTKPSDPVLAAEIANLKQRQAEGTFTAAPATAAYAGRNNAPNAPGAVLAASPVKGGLQKPPMPVPSPVAAPPPAPAPGLQRPPVPGGDVSMHEPRGFGGAGVIAPLRSDLPQMQREIQQRGPVPPSAAPPPRPTGAAVPPATPPPTGAGLVKPPTPTAAPPTVEQMRLAAEAAKAARAPGLVKVGNAVGGAVAAGVQAVNTGVPKIVGSAMDAANNSVRAATTGISTAMAPVRTWLYGSDQPSQAEIDYQKALDDQKRQQRGPVPIVGTGPPSISSAGVATPKPLLSPPPRPAKGLQPPQLTGR